MKKRRPLSSKKAPARKRPEERFHDVVHLIAVGMAQCYRCRETIYANEPIVYATAEPAKIYVAFHEHCWEGKTL